MQADDYQDNSAGAISQIVYCIHAAWATAHRALLENLRAYPWSFLAFRLLNSFFTIALAYLMFNRLFGGQTLPSFSAHTGSTDYLTFIVVGTGIAAYFNGALLNLGRSLITERRTGTLESLFLAPVPMSSYLVGVMLLHLLLTTLDFLIIIALSIPFGANLVRTNWLGLISILLIGHIGFLGMGVILAAVMLHLRDTYLTQNTVMAVLYLVCGVLFPIQYLPSWVQFVARFIPLTHTLVLARESALLGYGLAQQVPGLLQLLILSLIYCATGLLLVRRVKRVALEEALS